MMSIQAYASPQPDLLLRLHESLLVEISQRLMANATQQLQTADESSRYGADDYWTRPKAWARSETWPRPARVISVSAFVRVYGWHRWDHGLLQESQCSECGVCSPTPPFEDNPATRGTTAGFNWPAPPRHLSSIHRVGASVRLQAVVGS